MVQIAVAGLIGLAALLPEALALPGVQIAMEPLDAQLDAEHGEIATGQVLPRGEAHTKPKSSPVGPWTTRTGWTDPEDEKTSKTFTTTWTPWVPTTTGTMSSTAKCVVTTSSSELTEASSTTSKTSSTTSATASASSQPAGPGSCSALAAAKTFKEPVSGDVYEITCNYDYQDSDLPVVSVPDFASCFKVCSETKSCLSFSYDSGDGAGVCYLKYDIQGGHSATGVDTAKLISNGDGSPVVVTPPTKTSSSSTAVITTSPTAGVPGSCAQAQTNGQSFISPAGAKYTIECGVDPNGSDLVNVFATSFVECASACDDTVTCIGYSYTGGVGPGTCYLKSSITNGGAFPKSSITHGGAFPGVDFAYKPGATTGSHFTSAASWFSSTSSSSSVPVLTLTRTTSASVSVWVETKTRSSRSSSSSSSTSSPKSIIVESTTSSSPKWTVTKTFITSCSSEPVTIKTKTVTESSSEPVTIKTKTVTGSASTSDTIKTKTVTGSETKKKHHHKTKPIQIKTWLESTLPDSARAKPTDTTVTLTRSITTAKDGEPSSKPKPNDGQSWDEAYCYAIADAEQYLQVYVTAGNRNLDGWFVGAFNPADRSQTEVLTPNLTPYLDQAWKGVGYNDRELVITSTGVRHNGRKEKVSCESWDLRLHSDDNEKNYGECSWAKGRGSKGIIQGQDGNVTAVHDRFGGWLACAEKQTAVLRWEDNGKIEKADLNKCARIDMKLVKS